MALNWNPSFLRQNIKSQLYDSGSEVTYVVTWLRELNHLSWKSNKLLKTVKPSLLWPFPHFICTTESEVESERDCMRRSWLSCPQRVLGKQVGKKHGNREELSSSDSYLRNWAKEKQLLTEDGQYGYSVTTWWWWTLPTTICMRIFYILLGDDSWSDLVSYAWPVRESRVVWRNLGW